MLKIQGRIKLDVIGVDGQLKETTGWIKNGTTNLGKATMAGLILDIGSEDPFAYLAVGSDNTPFDPADTALGSEIVSDGLERASATVTRETTDTPNDTMQFEKVWTATGAVTVEEIGYFNDATAGIMGGRAITGTKVLATGEKLVGTYQIKLA